MVFKTVRNSLSGSVATWAFSGPAHHVTQDHPVYIPRDLSPGRSWWPSVRLSGVANPEKADYSAAASSPVSPWRRTAYLPHFAAAQSQMLKLRFERVR
jgi:hypothetical protein